MKGAGTYEAALIDVIIQSTNQEIFQIKQMYPDVEHRVHSETSGNFRKVLMEILCVTFLFVPVFRSFSSFCIIQFLFVRLHVCVLCL